MIINYFFFKFFNNIVTIPTLTKTPIPIIKYVIRFGILLPLSNFDLSESTRNGDDGDDGDHRDDRHDRSFSVNFIVLLEELFFCFESTLIKANQISVLWFDKDPSGSFVEEMIGMIDIVFC